MSEIFGIDGASFQGDINWAEVDSLCDFGAEKVTEGTGYVNPFWPAAKHWMAFRAEKTGFIPVAYLFLDANSTGAAQADWFARHAGDLTGWAIVVDVERSSTGSPTQFQASRCAARLRKHYPGHPIGGYAPKWFAGGWGLKFFSWIWASSYVTGSGDPRTLVKSVPSDYWTAYGAMKPLLLQFTASGRVTGVNGPVDCSVFRGTQEELARIILPPVKTAPKPTPRPVPVPAPVPVPEPAPAPVPEPVTHVSDPSGAVTWFRLDHDALPLHLPVWPAAAGPYEQFGMQLAGSTGVLVKVAFYDAAGKATPKVLPLTSGRVAEVMPEGGWGKVELVALSRLDKQAGLGCGVQITTW